MQPKVIEDIRCPKCGRVTHHYLNKETGEYRCVVCQSVNLTIKVKPKMEVVFEADPELEASLNHTQTESIEELLTNPNVDTEDGKILNDQGNPV